MPLPIFNFAEQVIKKTQEIQFVIISPHGKDIFTLKTWKKGIKKRNFVTSEQETLAMKTGGNSIKMHRLLMTLYNLCCLGLDQ